MPDLYASSSSHDAHRASLCVAWLRRYGITVCVAVPTSPSSETTACRAACFFISEDTLEDDPLLHQLHAVAMTGKPVILVLLDDLDLGRVRGLPVMEVQTIPAAGLSTAAVCQALLAVCWKTGVLRGDPSRFGRNRSQNQLRSTVSRAIALRRLAYVAAAVLLVAVIGFQWTKHRKAHAEAPVIAAIPVDIKTMPLSVPTTPVAPPSNTPTPPARASLPVANQPAPADRAMSHVRACIGSTARSNGLTDAQIDGIVEFFGDTVWIDGKGKQPKALLRSSMVQRSREFPTFKEIIDEITAEPSDNPTKVRVLVRSHTNGENIGNATITADRLVANYTVEFDADNRPRITAIDFLKKSP